jgi:hypothetical protein
MTQALEAALTELSKVKDGFNEDDIERLFQNVYLELGYKTVGRDILGKRKSKKAAFLMFVCSTVTTAFKSLSNSKNLN